MPSENKSKRQRIREHIILTLEEKTNARVVSTRLPQDLEHIQAFPYIFVATGSEQTLPHESFGAAMLANLEIPITVFVQMSHASNDVHGDLDDMIKEIDDALHVDISRGEQAINTWLSSIDTDEGHWRPYAAAQLRFTVKYEYTVADR